MPVSFGRGGQQTWIEAPRSGVADAATARLKDTDPNAWRLFDGDADGHYALWAYRAAEGGCQAADPLEHRCDR